MLHLATIVDIHLLGDKAEESFLLAAPPATLLVIVLFSCTFARGIEVVTSLTSAFL